MSLTAVPALPLAGRQGVVLAVFIAMSVGVAQAQAAPATPSIIATMLKWTPLLAQGFALNIAMSFLAMAIGTVFGFALGLGQISLLAPARACARLITQFFRKGFEPLIKLRQRLKKRSLLGQRKAGRCR